MHQLIQEVNSIKKSVFDDEKQKMELTRAKYKDLVRRKTQEAQESMSKADQKVKEVELLREELRSVKSEFKLERSKWGIEEKRL